MKRFYFIGIETLTLIFTGMFFFSCSFKSKEDKLIDAIKKNSLQEVQKVIKSGADVNASFEDLENQNEIKTLLILAVEHGNIDILKFLIDSGADINSNISSNTPLMAATESDDLNSVKILVEAGANVNAENQTGDKALDIAYQHKNQEMITFLKSQGANASLELSELHDIDWNRIPLWMENSALLVSEMAFGKPKLIKEIFSSPKETTFIKKLSYTNDSFEITACMGKDDMELFEMTLNFKCTKIAESGTCFISSLEAKNLISFENVSLQCSSPSDGYSYGKILGVLSSLHPAMFD